MKYAIYLGLLLVLIFGIYSYLNKESNSNTYVSPKSSKGIILYKEKGDVYIKNKGEDIVQPVGASSIEINNQTEVTTGSSSRASILLPDNSLISLSENTVITINYGEYGTSVFQSLGQTYHRVQKLVTGKSYEVQTPSTLAAVRGTKFAILYDGATKKTKVAVTENTVAVSRVKKVEGVATSTPESPILVGQGNTANVTEYKVGENKKESHVEIVSNNEDSVVKSWIEENKPVDVKFDEFKADLEKGNTDSFRENVDKVLEKSEPVIENTDKKADNEVETKKTDESKPDIKTDEVKAEVEKKKTEEVKPKEEVQKVETKSVVSSVIKKYNSDEEFTTVFDDLLIKYFYIDDEESICEVDVPPETKAKETLALAQANGHDFDITKLLNLAIKVKNYCAI